MNEALAIIPARGGSKRVPRKNVRLLAGKPLIAWTIQAALRSRRLGRVIVSTDDDETASIAKKYGAEVPFMRPKILAQDGTPTVSVLRHAAAWLKSHERYIPEAVVTLQPTSPLRTAGHIDAALRLFARVGADSVVSVCRAEHSPYLLLKVRNGRAEPLLKPVSRHKSRQDPPSVFRLNGAIYVTRYRTLVQSGKILGRDTRVMVMRPDCSIDIDTLLDFRLAELVARSLRARH